MTSITGSGSPDELVLIYRDLLGTAKPPRLARRYGSW